MGFEIVVDEERIKEIEEAAAGELRRVGCPTEWSKVGVVYEDQYLMILRDAVIFPDGKAGTYIRMLGRTGPGVAVLPVYGDKVVLVRHFRHATRSRHLEIPRGFGSADMLPEDSARRELAEEIGAHADRLMSLGLVHPNTGLGSDAVELFVAEVTTVGEAERHEAIDRVLTLDCDELEGLIRDARVTDSFTITAYTRASLRGLLPRRRDPFQG